jgi:N-acetylneuraminate lyase
MKITPLTGLIAATHTPFHKDGSLNLAAVETQAAHLLANDVNTVFIAGTTGEGHLLTSDERKALAARWMDVARGSAMRVIVHVGHASVAEAAALAAHAQSTGALAVAALAPNYFKPRTPALLAAACAEIAAAAPRLPFYYYDIPAWTGVSLPMAQFLQEAAPRIPNLAGIKYTNTDLAQFQSCIHFADGRFDILLGTDESLLAGLVLGAQGAVGSTYNFAAPIYHRLMADWEKDDLASARWEQFRSVQLVNALAPRGYMGAAKAVMAMLGVDVGPARLPNDNLDAAQVAALRRDLEQLGFFDWIKR